MAVAPWTSGTAADDAASAPGDDGAGVCTALSGLIWARAASAPTRRAVTANRWREPRPGDAVEALTRRRTHSDARFSLRLCQSGSGTKARRPKQPMFMAHGSTASFGDPATTSAGSFGIVSISTGNRPPGWGRSGQVPLSGGTGSRQAPSTWRRRSRSAMSFGTEQATGRHRSPGRSRTTPGGVLWDNAGEAPAASTGQARSRNRQRSHWGSSTEWLAPPERQ